MGRLAQLLREIAPAWMAEKQPVGETSEILHFRQKESGVSASDADKAWLESVEKGLFGADTADYTYVSEGPPSAPASAEDDSEQPQTAKQP
jgi:hypothetical protein